MKPLSTLLASHSCLRVRSAMEALPRAVSMMEMSHATYVALQLLVFFVWYCSNCRIFFTINRNAHVKYMMTNSTLVVKKNVFFFFSKIFVSPDCVISIKSLLKPFCCIKFCSVAYFWRKSMLVHCFIMFAMGHPMVRSVAVAYRQRRGLDLLLISIVALHE